jgi:hypothetical protein
MPGPVSEWNFIAGRDNTAARANGKSHLMIVPKKEVHLSFRDDWTMWRHHGIGTAIQLPCNK